MLKKLRKAIAKALPGDTEKYLGTALALATGNPLFAGIGALADPEAGFGDVARTAFLANLSPGLKVGGLDLTKANKLFGDTGIMSKVMGADKSGLGFREFLLGRKGKPGRIKFEDGIAKMVEGPKGTPGLFGTEGKFFEEGASNLEKLQQLSKIAGIAGLIGAPFMEDLFKVPEEETATPLFPSSDYKGQMLDISLPALQFADLASGIYGPYMNPYTGIMENKADGGIIGMAQGGEFPRKTGEISGPGTGTSDSIPAMLSDGEFVMTAKAVKGAGNGDRMAGARKMYEMMDNLEAQA